MNRLLSKLTKPRSWLALMKQRLMLRVASPPSSSWIVRSLSTQQPQLRPNLTIDPKSSFFSGRRPASQPRASHLREEKERDANDIDSSSNPVIEDDGDSIDAGYSLRIPEIHYAVPLPDRLKVTVHTLFAPQYDNQVGTLWLDAHVFGRDPIRVDLLKRAVNYYRNKKRGRRKAVTKTIAQVSGSGRKVRQQKGTGMARAGHKRPPHWRGGAKAHGPKNITDYGNTKLNKKTRQLALCHVLSQKLKEGNLIVLDQLHQLPSHKTRELAHLLAPWDKLGHKDGATALVLDQYDEDETIESSDTPSQHNHVPINFWVAARNLPRLTVGSHHAASVYDILKHEKLVLTLAAVQAIEKRYVSDEQ